MKLGNFLKNTFNNFKTFKIQSLPKHSLNELDNGWTT